MGKEENNGAAHRKQDDQQPLSLSPTHTHTHTLIVRSGQTYFTYLLQITINMLKVPRFSRAAIFIVIHYESIACRVADAWRVCYLCTPYRCV